MFKNSKMIPLSEPNLKGNELRYLQRCIDTNWVSSAGSFVDDFEDALLKKVKAKYAVACLNGTAGLFIALKLCGVKRGDEVLVPTLTFIAPVNAVKYLGAEPVFMDCDDFLNIDPIKLEDFCNEECILTKAGLKNKKSKRIIKAIIPVHIFGNPCNMELIMKLAKKYRSKVIEDATESLGSYYREGIYKNRFTGTIGNIGVYSFNGNKIITSGSGGMLVTNNRNLAMKARYLVNQAKDDSVRSIHNEIGYNFRLSNLQAALGLAQLEQLDKFIKAKRVNFKLYKEELADIDGIRLLGVPEGAVANHWFYSLVIEKNKFGADKDELMNNLAEKGIQTRPIWFLNHLQKPYRRNQTYKIEKAIWFWERVLNLPCSSNLKKTQIKQVVSEIKKVRKSGKNKTDSN